MTRYFNFLFGLYLLLGLIILPNGNFGLIGQLPEMYDHCKATEDKDMTVFDFVSDHLICMDAMFDAHGNGDEQKPHKPVKVDFQIEPTFFQVVRTKLPSPIVVQGVLQFQFQPTVLYAFYCLSDIFRPPSEAKHDHSFSC